MKNLKKRLINILKISCKLLLFLFLSFKAYSSDILLEIRGNDFTDNDVILSLIKEKPSKLDEEYSNYLIKTLDNSNLFDEVSVKIEENKFIIFISEYANLNKIYYRNNERLKNEELDEVANQLNLSNSNPNSINNFITEVKKIYNSFGYNNIEITYSLDVEESSNVADLYIEFNEGEITKISNIYFEGNDSVSKQSLRSVIKSKTKTLRNIFANNNYKEFIVENDLLLISRYYKNNGFIDIVVDYKVEFLKSNKVNLYFNISEGNKYYLSTIKYIDVKNILDQNLNLELQNLINENINDEDKNYYSLSMISNLKQKISNKIIGNGLEFVEIKSLEKIDGNKVDILFEILPVEPKYVNQINIYGNSRTYDHVIRREISVAEGDPINSLKINEIKDKLRSLNLFNKVEIEQKNINEDEVDISLNVEEKQTGTFNAGVSVGSLDGLGVIVGLSERNFYGTGRSLNALINTSDTQTEYTLETTDRLFYENDVDISYLINYKEQDFSNAKSYNLNTSTVGIGLSYDLNPKIKHKIGLDYLIKDYSITNVNTVSSVIDTSSGENVSFLLKNNITYSSLNPGFIKKDGQLISVNNFIETPTSSTNGYIKNIFTYRNYKSLEKNIFSFQSRLGNIQSLSNNDILSDDKFSLGGRWLRGFDNFGAGPRNSRTSYVGGNNLFVTKLDYSRELTDKSDFPIQFNLFNDYGLLWGNKTDPINYDTSLRSSVGFGLRYYSPIGPIGFSWGFPILDEEYDIKRMFLFSIGNID